MVDVYFKTASTPYSKDALHTSIKKLFEKINVVEKGDIVAIKLHM
ncbi:MAG TPA: 4Fe-4S ferredoxin, partial [Thermoplasmata archaeon]|nr:4Fe-4S ferredoxin [Thermoplasmata archaeon]